MLEIKNIKKIYNPGEITEMTLFNGFSLNVDEGEFLSVVGSNGSGKTSLLNIICGSIPVEGGKISIDGKDITKDPEYKRYRYIGRVYQNPSLGSCPNLTIEENMSLAGNKGKRFGISPGVVMSKPLYYRSLLEPLGLGLEDKMDVRVGLLSGGQRQALSLIMATMTPIKFLILDEHTAALDPKTAETIMELTDRIVKQKHLTAIMVTHNLRYAVDYGSRMIMMHKGDIVLDRYGAEKEKTQVKDLLALFNSISIECGN